MARHLGCKNISWDREGLERLYWAEKLSMKKIAERHNTQSQSVLEAMRKFNIPRRTISEATSGEASFRWKGQDYSYIDANGYRFVRAPKGHPYADKHGYIREHRLLIEQQLGYPLPSSIIVHHLNGVYTDNRLANLVWLDKKTHDKLIPILQKRIRQLEKQLIARNKQAVMV